MKSKWQI